MPNFKIILAGLCTGVLLAFSASAQTTNAPATVIENFELRTDTVIVKGFSTVGSVAIGDAAISVHSKESSDIGHRQKAYGIMVIFSGSGNQPRQMISKTSLVVDDDELDALTDGMDYIGKVTYDVTALAGFDASYTTKSGLRISAHSDRRQGGIKTYIQFGGAPKIALSTEQLTQLRNLIVQAKTSLDAIK